MKQEILTKYKTDDTFRAMIWSVMAMDHGNCCSCDDNCDFTCSFVEFLEKEYGITENDLDQLWVDSEREFDEFENDLPKCCGKTDYFGGKCQHCGKDMMDVPGLWEAWHCNGCKGTAENKWGCFNRDPPMPKSRCKFER